MCRSEFAATPGGAGKAYTIVFIFNVQPGVARGPSSVPPWNNGAFDCTCEGEHLARATKRLRNCVPYRYIKYTGVILPGWSGPQLRAPRTFRYRIIRSSAGT